MASSLRAAASCQIVTTGRASGRRHRVRVWFVLDGTTLYAMSRHGIDADWVRNLRVDPRVQVRAGRTAYPGTARLVTDPSENERARRLQFDKYAPRHRGLEGWLDGPATVVAIEVAGLEE